MDTECWWCGDIHDGPCPERLQWQEMLPGWGAGCAESISEQGELFPDDVHFFPPVIRPREDLPGQRKLPGFDGV
jgi:hypothetical protein